VTAPPPPVPDEKDWTWTLQRACPECGFEATALDRAEISLRTREVMGRLADALARPDAANRPEPTVWSPLEYVCHVRDVCTVFADRVEMMRTQANPEFANWDQDETAVAKRYWAQEPATVAREAREAAGAAATAFGGVGADEWDRAGQRSNSSMFTVDSLGRYFLHDLYHHAWDVGV
jgi:hypothetical protein